MFHRHPRSSESQNDHSIKWDHLAHQGAPRSTWTLDSRRQSRPLSPQSTAISFFLDTYLAIRLPLHLLEMHFKFFLPSLWAPFYSFVNYFHLVSPVPDHQSYISYRVISSPFIPFIPLSESFTIFSFPSRPTPASPFYLHYWSTRPGYHFSKSLLQPLHLLNQFFIKFHREFLVLYTVALFIKPKSSLTFFTTFSTCHFQQNMHRGTRTTLQITFGQVHG